MPKGSSIKDVRSEGGVKTNADKIRQGEGSFIACGRPPSQQNIWAKKTMLPHWPLARRIHSRIHKTHAAEAANADDDNDNDDDADAAPQEPTSTAGTDAPATDEMPVVRNLFDWLQSAFVEYTN